jgi:hypothetical protein
MKAGRIPCCVPFCGRTFKAEGGDVELMCGKHWRLARPALRRRHTRVVRRCRAAILKKDWRTAERAWRLENAIWAAIKRQATEVAAGIAG